MHFDGWQMGWMWVGWWVPLLVLGLVIWALTRRSGSGESSALRTPEQTLKERYARGELDRDEYQQRLSDLRR